MKYSVNLTIHDKGFLLSRVLESIKDFTTDEYEIIAVLDGCADNSEEVLLKFIQRNPQISIKVFKTPDVFETKANNVAARNSSGKFIAIVQDDMVMNERGWNERLAKPIEMFDDVLAVTAKTAHNYIANPRSTHAFLKQNLDNCWCDILMCDDPVSSRDGASTFANPSRIPRNQFVIRETVCRGPLLLDHSKLKVLGYFDEAYAPQNMDDHDLCYRAYKEHKWVAGIYWVDFMNDPEWSATKTHDSSRVPSWLYRVHHKNTRLCFARHRDVILGPKHNEVRVVE
tara:strand:- start:9918 stop:10769 length:852 start_codon:yes stop_codon:yes gene_type:complete